MINQENQKKQSPFLKGILLLIHRADITILASLPLLLSIITFILLYNILSKGDQSNLSEKSISIAGACSAFIASLSGVIQIYRRESPSFINFRGIWPVVSGVIWVTLCWAIGGVLIWYAMVMR